VAMQGIIIAFLKVFKSKAIFDDYPFEFNKQHVDNLAEVFSNNQKLIIV
jgi:hypothetical protein